MAFLTFSQRSFYTDAAPIVKTISICFFSHQTVGVFDSKTVEVSTSANFATNIVHSEKGKTNLHK